MTETPEDEDFHGGCGLALLVVLLPTTAILAGRILWTLVSGT